MVYLFPKQSFTERIPKDLFLELWYCRKGYYEVVQIHDIVHLDNFKEMADILTEQTCYRRLAKVDMLCHMVMT